MTEVALTEARKLRAQTTQDIVWEHDTDARACVVLDPSLLLVERSLINIEYNLAVLSEHFSFYISRHFHDILQEGKSESLTIDYFRYTSKLVDIDRLKTFLEENSENIQKFEIPEGASSEYGIPYKSIFESLPAKYRYEETLHNIIFEEWFFLKEHSWLVARTKRIFNLFIRSGSASLEFGSRIFDRAVERTLWREQIQVVQQAQRLRAVSKWLAVAGASLANLSFPIVQVIADLGVGMYFLLFDP